MVLASAWILGGAYLDSWAHRHVLSLDTIFTPFHALLYSGLFAATVLLVARLAWRGLPPGYELSLAGCLLFGVSGLLDLGWHTVFGIERGLQAGLSPTHLLLMVSAGLIVAGPLRAAWRRDGSKAGWRAVAGATLLLATLTFFGQFDHPFISQWSAGPGPPAGIPAEPYEQLGVLGILLHTAFLVAVLLLLLNRRRLPFGAITLILGASGILVTLLEKPDLVILVAIAAGLFGDVLYRLLRPSTWRRPALRAFSTVLPIFLWALYFDGIRRFDGIWWPVHVVIGAVVAAGLCGLLVSYLVVPPLASTLERVVTDSPC